MKVYFYGSGGYCIECKQPLEGAGCPYCGWVDRRSAQTKECAEGLLISPIIRDWSGEEEDKAWSHLQLGERE